MTPTRIFVTAVAMLTLSIPASAGTIRVMIENLDFAPKDVHAKVGDTVEWVNRDAFAHTATAVNGAWNVKLAPKQKGRLVLKKAGTFAYFCQFHPNMKGQVVVMP
jgi:plastocyanin